MASAAAASASGYDADGDGQLSAVEKKLRKYDVDKTGRFSLKLSINRL